MKIEIEALPQCDSLPTGGGGRELNFEHKKGQTKNIRLPTVVI